MIAEKTNGGTPNNLVLRLKELCVLACCIHTLRLLRNVLRQLTAEGAFSILWLSMVAFIGKERQKHGQIALKMHVSWSQTQACSECSRWCTLHVTRKRFLPARASDEECLSLMLMIPYEIMHCRAKFCTENQRPRNPSGRK